VDEFEVSGSDRAEFCRDRGLALSTLQRHLPQECKLFFAPCYADKVVKFGGMLTVALTAAQTAVRIRSRFRKRFPRPAGTRSDL
jgi:hypothetical protein